MKVNLIALCAVVMLAATGGLWHASTAPHYTIDGISCSSSRDAAKEAGFPDYEVGADTWVFHLIDRPYQSVCTKDGDVVNVSGKSLDRNGATILSAGASKSDALDALGPLGNVRRVGGSESVECCFEYHDIKVELYFVRNSLSHIELGNRVNWGRVIF